MQLIIDKNAFHRLVKDALPVVPKKSTKPILTNVLLKADPLTKELAITACDHDELVYKSSVEANVSEGGETVVSAKDLCDITKSLPAGEVEVFLGPADTAAKKEKALSLLPEDQNDVLNHLCIQTEKAKFSLTTLSPDEFPSIERETSGDQPAAFHAGILKSAISRTLYAASREETRYYLGGLYFEDQGDLINVVATDGHRMGKCNFEQSAKPLFCGNGKPSAILSIRLMGVLQKLLNDQEDTVMVKCQIQDKWAWFRIGDTTLQGLLVDGAFPDYRQVIPKSVHFCTVDLEAIKGALTRVSQLSPDKTGGVRFHFRPKDGCLSLSTEHTGRGKAREEIDASELEVELEMGFNAFFWLDALKTLTSDRVMISYVNHLSPAVLNPCNVENEADLSQAHVVMPMRL